MAERLGLVAFIGTSVPFFCHYFGSRSLSFQLDWDDQVNFVDNTLLDDKHASFFERAMLATGSSGIFLGVWEPMSLWMKMILAHFSSEANTPVIKIDLFLIFAIFLHSMNTLLLLKLVIKLRKWINYDIVSKQQDLNNNNSSKSWNHGSSLGVMIWSLHPLRVETVCWMSCLPYLIALFFSLLSFHTLIIINEFDDENVHIMNKKKIENENVLNCKSKISSPKNINKLHRKQLKKNKYPDFFFNVIPVQIRKFILVLLFTFFYLCSILSKAAALPMLGIYLVFQFFIATSTSSSTSSSNSNLMKNFWKCLFQPFLYYFLGCIFVAFYGMRKAIWANNIGMQITEEHPQNALKIPRHLDLEGFSLEKTQGDVPGLFTANWWWEKPLVHRLAKACYSLSWYMSHTFFPRGLCIFYPVGREFEAQQVTGLAVLIALFTFFALCFTLHFLWRRVKHIKTSQLGTLLEYSSITWLSYLGIIFPTLGILFEHGWPIFAADRYSYIPSTLLVPWFGFVWSRLPRHKSLPLLFTCLIACLAVQSCFTASKWQDSTSLWQHAVTYGPRDVVAHYNLGCVYEREGKLSNASTLFEQAVNIDNTYGAAWNNWGFVREQMSDLIGAENCYRKAVSLNPDRHYTAHNNIAKLLHMHGSNMKRKNKVKSDSTDIIHHYSEAIRIYPLYGKALYNLATYFHTMNPEEVKELTLKEFSTSNYHFNENSFELFEETASLYRRAIMSSPHLYESYHNLASLLLTHHSDILRTSSAASMLIESRKLLDFVIANYPTYERPKMLLPMVDEAWKKLPSHLKPSKQ